MVLNIVKVVVFVHFKLTVSLRILNNVVNANEGEFTLKFFLTL